MDSVRVYICAGIFVLLTALRFFAPETGECAQELIGRALKYEREQTEYVLCLVGQKSEKKPTQELKTLSVRAAPVEKTAAPAPDPVQTPSPVPTENPSVTAFLEAQSAYSDYPTPDDVSITRPELPFEYISPVTGITSSGFGYRLHPIKNEVKFHYGTDFAADTGAAVAAFADGTVVAQGDSDSYGKYVIIDHADGYRTLYAHCSSICVGCGAVKKGDTVALVGATGAATGPHLHFELEHNGMYLNPEFYV